MQPIVWRSNYYAASEAVAELELSQPQYQYTLYSVELDSGKSNIYTVQDGDERRWIVPGRLR